MSRAVTSTSRIHESARRCRAERPSEASSTSSRAHFGSQSASAPREKGGRVMTAKWQVRSRVSGSRQLPSSANASCPIANTGELGRRARADRPHRVDGVGTSAPLHLHAVHAERRIVGDGGAHPGQSLRGGRDRIARRVVLVRGHRGRNQDHALEPERLAHLLGRAQMAEVDRVEGAAEDAEPGSARHSRSWPFPRSTNLRVVSPSSPIGP